MHYGPYFFARDPTRKTIVNKYPLPIGVHMGQRVGPSAVIHLSRTLNILYTY